MNRLSDSFQSEPIPNRFETAPASSSKNWLKPATWVGSSERLVLSGPLTTWNAAARSRTSSVTFHWTPSLGLTFRASIPSAWKSSALTPSVQVTGEGKIQVAVDVTTGVLEIVAVVEAVQWLTVKLNIGLVVTVDEEIGAARNHIETVVPIDVLCLGLIA